MLVATLALLSLASNPAPGEFEGGSTWVATSTGEIWSFTPNLSGPNIFPVTGAREIEFGPDGRLYVSKTTTIEVYDSAGTLIRTLTSPYGDSSLRGMTFDVRGWLLVADTANDQVLVFSDSGAFIIEEDFGGILDGPTDIAISNNGHRFIACETQDRVWEIDPSGDLIQSTTIEDPAELCFTNTGSLLVVSTGVPWITQLAPRDGASYGQIDDSDYTSIAPWANGRFLATTQAGELRQIAVTNVSLEDLGWTFSGGAVDFESIAVAPFRFKVTATIERLGSTDIEKETTNGVVTILPNSGEASFWFNLGSSAEYSRLQGSCLALGEEKKIGFGVSGTHDGSALALNCHARVVAEGKWVVNAAVGSSLGAESPVRFIPSKVKGTFSFFSAPQLETRKFVSTKRLN